MAYFRRYHLWPLLSLFLLAACGGASEPVAQAPSQPAATPAPQATAVAAVTAAPSPVAQSLPTAAVAQPSAAPTAAVAGIPESTTLEGYHILGRADAPVTLTMYSDFL